MSVTLATLRDQVRSMMDLDETDLPNSVIDQFAREAFQRVYTLERRWPYLQTTYTTTTSANVRSYPIENIGDIREIISIVDTSASGNRFTLIDHNNAEEVWLGNTDVPGRPYFFSVWEKQIHLWPTPDESYSLKIRAYRNPSYDWLADDEVDIDIDEWFHALLPYYVISKAYQRQEDSELSAMHMKSFEEGVALARRDLMKASGAQPVIMSSGRRYPTMRRWLQTLGATLGQ